MAGGRDLAKKDENTGFACARCGANVQPVTNGSYRNHCPDCLWSLHVDGARPGDRAGSCGALMAPVGITKSRKGYQIVHRCEGCGALRRNIAALDTVQDDLEALLRLMMTADVDLGAGRSLSSEPGPNRQHRRRNVRFTPATRKPHDS